ncbi:MAG TPA: class I SAM-dependent methyltransferase [Solirubrobacterales bacterium]|nr:class I SAM-dependent methyltransferase [Solirubrobacterales bacterium]
MRGSIFDDPGDEKSWHISQRAESLSSYYEGRDPSWYASAVAPLTGANRVLDLGCGPGLALRALRDLGSSSVLGIDRWPAFAAMSTPEVPIIVHDLSLPMPFLESGSFDGVFSHYVLDYVSPICARQILREARRVLAPGGRLVLYVAAVGLAGGDESRTIPYSVRAVRALVEEAGFDEIEVEATSNGRNTVARAVAGSPPVARAPEEPWAAVEGDTQLSVLFSGASDGLTLEVVGEGRRASFQVDLPPAERGVGQRVAVAARAQRLAGGGTDLQLWTWHGLVPAVAERAIVEFPAGKMRIELDGEEVEHVSVWRPNDLGLEPVGNAHVRIADLPLCEKLDDAARSAEGRQVVIGPVTDDVEWERLGNCRNRFLIRRATSLGVDGLEREWLGGRLHGVALDVAELDGNSSYDVLLWAERRQSVLYLEGRDWESLVGVAKRRAADLDAPLVLVDPVLGHDAPVRPFPEGVAAFAADQNNRLVLLGAKTRVLVGQADLGRLAGRLLAGGAEDDRRSPGLDVDETLRHLTERTLLMRLRQTRGHSWAEVGRRPGRSP